MTDVVVAGSANVDLVLAVVSAGTDGAMASVSDVAATDARYARVYRPQA